MDVLIDVSYIGKEIEKIRNELNISVENFSEKTSIPVKKLFSFEAGLKMPSIEELIIICNVFSKKFDDMISYEIKH